MTSLIFWLDFFIPLRVWLDLFDSKLDLFDSKLDLFDSNARCVSTRVRLLDFFIPVRGPVIFDPLSVEGEKYIFYYCPWDVVVFGLM